MDSNEPNESEVPITAANVEAESQSRSGPKPSALVLGALAIAGVALLALAFSGGDGGGATDADAAGASNGLYEFAFTDEDGTEGSLADFQGEPLVVIFFASWCAPCRAELPDFEEVHIAAEDRVQFVGISHDIDESSWLSLIDETGLTFPTRFQPEQEIWEELNLFGMPSTAFISADGEVLYTFSGILDQETLIELIDEHLNVEV